MFLWTSYFLAKKFLSKTTTKSTITYQSSDRLWSNSRNLYQLGCQVLMMTWFTNQILRLNVWVVCFWALFLGIVFRHGFFSLPLATGGCSADFTWRTEDASAFENMSWHSGQSHSFESWTCFTLSIVFNSSFWKGLCWNIVLSTWELCFRSCLT